MYNQNVLEGCLIKEALMVRLIILISVFVRDVTLKRNP